MLNESREPNRVRSARKKVGLTREQLAVKAGLSSSTLYLAERGLISPATAEKIAPLLGVRADSLLSGEGSR